MTAGFCLITAILLWFGAVVAVRCERGADDRVDVTVAHRILGLVDARTEHFPDVVRAVAVQKPGGPRRGGSGRSGGQLKLTLRDGREWESTPVPRHFAGMGPVEMAERIRAYLEQPRAPALEMRWIPWLMCVLAVPFVLCSALLLAALVNTLRRGAGGAAT